MNIATGLPELPRMLHPKTGDVILARNLPTGRGRWTPVRKCLVVEAVGKGLLSVEEAAGKYGLSESELLRMAALYEQYGISGLSVSKWESDASAGHCPLREGAMPGVIEAQDVILDREAGSLHVGMRRVPCSRQELLVLELLMLDAGRVVVYEELMAHLYDARKRERVRRDILKVLVCQLRKKLRGDGDRAYIESVWGLGYRFRDE